MPNNFKLTGNRYISKEGNDANDGLTPDTPKATFASYSAGANIVGSGNYKGAFVVNTDACRMIPDGTVKLDCTSNFSIGGTTNSKTIGDVSKEHYFFINLNGFALLSNSGQFAASDHVLNKCVISNGQAFRSIAGVVPTQFNNCVLIDVTPSTSSDAGYNTITTMNFCTLINTRIKQTVNLCHLFNCYVNPYSIIEMTTYYDIPAGQFYNNNFQGQFLIGGVLYELKRDSLGNPVENNPLALDVILLDADVYNRGNFSEDPQYLNLENGDYWSVVDTSPMLYNANSPFSNIADCKIGSVIKAIDSGWSLNDLDYFANNFTIDPLQSSGFAISPAIQIAPISQRLGVINHQMLLAFNSDEVINSNENNNVLALENFVAGTDGANPRRLIYEMRWSNSDTVPILDADWDNSGYSVAGEYFKFEANTIPKVDNNFLGNGELGYNVLSQYSIRAKWVQFRLTLLNGIG